MSIENSSRGKERELPEDAADRDLQALDSSASGRQVVEGGGIRIAAYGAGSMLSIVGIVVVTRALGPADFGVFQTILNIAAIVVAITDLGLVNLGIREYAQRSGEERERLLGALLAFRLSLSLLGFLAIVGVTVLRGYDSALVLGAAAVGLGGVLMVAQATIAVPLYAQLRFRALAVADLARQGVQTAFYIAAGTLGLSAAWFLVAAIPAQVVALLVTVGAVGVAAIVLPRFDGRDLRVLAGAGIAFSAAAAAGSVYQFATQIITSFAASPDVTGYFSIAQRVAVVLVAVPALLTQSAFPVLSRAAVADRERFERIVGRLTYAGGFVGVVMAVGVMSGAGFIVEVTAGSQFEAAVPAMVVLGASLALTSVIFAWGAALLALRCHAPLIVVNALGIAVAGVLVVATVGRVGAVGPAFATLAGEFVLIVCCGWLLHRRGVPMVRPALKALGVAGLGIVIVAGLHLVALNSLISAMIAIGLFSLAAIALAVIPEELTPYLPAVLARRARA